MTTGFLRFCWISARTKPRRWENTQLKSAVALFKPSASFSESFSFVKGTEFYKLPPPPPPTADVSDSAQGAQIDASRQSGPLESPSTSASATPQSSAAQSTYNRNAILVFEFGFMWIWI